jgi:hypothetical protein
MMQINFSTNWNNKLSCQAFTTLRIYNAEKHVTGTAVDIQLKGNTLDTGIIKQVKVLNIEQINDYIAYLDTGYSREECMNILKRMYSTADWNTTRLALILIVKDKKSKP